VRRRAVSKNTIVRRSRASGFQFVSTRGGFRGEETLEGETVGRQFPAIESAATRPRAPGIAPTRNSRLERLAHQPEARMREMAGVPASVTNAIRAPRRIRSTNSGARRSSLCSK